MENFNAALWYTHAQACIQIKQQQQQKDRITADHIYHF